MPSGRSQLGAHALGYAALAALFVPTAATFIDSIYRISADAFVSGAPQHDDMTLLVVRAI